MRGVFFLKRIVALLLVCLLLTGCGSWMDGAYSSVTPHKVREQAAEQTMPAVKNIAQIKAVLAAFVEDGADTGLFSVEEFPAVSLDRSMATAISYILQEHPIGAYAVESITYELGTTGGVNAVAVTVVYSRSIDEIRAIQTVSDMEQAVKRITNALTDFEPSVVLRIQQYETLDLDQLVADLALQNPDVVMETPQVMASVFPQEGAERVLDVRFTYQTSRDSLRTMQAYVKPVFASAALYVSSEEETAGVKYARLYTFLMERNAYQVKTSITPSYSLLRHGVGDSRAFAIVYAAMCRKAGLECQVVNGTCNGEAWFWNIICEDGIWYHVDVLSQNGFIKYTDSQMAGYVWDYSAYPACGG